MTRQEVDQRYRKRAVTDYHEAGTIEIDDGAPVSLSDGGAYVQAWVWVDDEDAGVEFEDRNRE